MIVWLALFLLTAMPLIAGILWLFWKLVIKPIQERTATIWRRHDLIDYEMQLERMVYRR